MKVDAVAKWLGLIGLLCSSWNVRAAKEVSDFALLDAKGRYHHLRQADAKAVVLFFTANGCPIARQSIPRLKGLEKRFEPEGICFWLIDSNSADDRESILKEAGEFHFGNRLRYGGLGQREFCSGLPHAARMHHGHQNAQLAQLEAPHHALFQRDFFAHE